MGTPLFIYLIMASLVLAACGSGRAAPEVTAPVEVTRPLTADGRFSGATGRALYIQHCALCHGDEGRGDGPTAEALDPRPADFTDHEFMAGRSNQDLFKVISEGKPPMPGWAGVLNEEQRWQVIAYMRTFTYQPAGPLLAIAEPTARPEGEPPSFQQDVLPILVANCVRCHSGDSAPNGLRLTDYETVMKGSLFLPVVRPGAPESSPLYLTTSKATMPADGQPLNQIHVQTIYDWIVAGAPDN